MGMMGIFPCLGVDLGMGRVVVFRWWGGEVQGLHLE